MLFAATDCGAVITIGCPRCVPWRTFLSYGMFQNTSRCSASCTTLGRTPSSGEIAFITMRTRSCEYDSIFSACIASSESFTLAYSVVVTHSTIVAISTAISASSFSMPEVSRITVS